MHRPSGEDSRAWAPKQSISKAQSSHQSSTVRKEERSNEQVAGGTSECVILPPGHLIVPAYALAHSTE